MFSMTTEPITPPDMSAMSEINVAGVLISLGVGITVWLVASFMISVITKRIAAGSTFFKKPYFRWAAPALRALEHERRVQRAHTIGALLRSVVGVLISVLTSVYVLKNLNVDVAPILTSVGILGIAIGFGAQQLIRDFLAGVFITIEDQYGIGDIIETSEVVGTVEAMNLRITRVRVRGRHHLVPAQRRNPAGGQPLPGQLRPARHTAGRRGGPALPSRKRRIGP